MPRGFAGRLALIAAAGLALRLLYVLWVMHGRGVAGDGAEFHILANQLADGLGYVQPLIVSPDHLPTADKPPLYPLLLALPSWLGLDSIGAHRVVSALMGTALVPAVGLLGRRAGGERAGLIAAALAAVHPALVVLDGSLRSESLYAPLIALALLAAYRLLDRPTAARAGVLGGLVGLAALTRSEALLLLALLVVPVAALTPRGSCARTVAVAGLAFALVLAPWLVRNWARFDRPLLSTNAGSLAYGANCDAAYHGELTGSWPCFPPLRATGERDEADVSAELRRRGTRYARDHAGRVPAVVAVRELRTWDLWDPGPATRLEARIGDRDLGAHRAGVAVHLLLLVPAVGGALALRRRGERLRVLLAPVALAIAVAALGYGTTRFRVPADVAIVILAAVAIGALADRRGSRTTLA
ncbi:MAG TPA: glycosyltransferase family 39 protein [Thermoleophilaceae bacterium]|jgi:4-amino-4-deoxy-L-arabinose transferase-like glycosyltransferase